MTTAIEQAQANVANLKEQRRLTMEDIWAGHTGRARHRSRPDWLVGWV